MTFKSLQSLVLFSSSLLNAQVIPGRREKRRMLRPFSVPVVVFALALSSCAVHAQLTEHQPKILFDGGEWRDETNHQIYVMDPDGSHVQPLTEKPPGTISHNAFAAWSPDRQKIVFDSTRDGNFEIYVMDADGGNVWPILRLK